MSNSTHQVAVLAFDRVRLMDLTAPLEVFTTATALTDGDYRVRVCTTDGRAVRSAAGLLVVPDAKAEEIDNVDTLIVPGIIDPDEYHQHPEWINAVATLAKLATRVAAVCTGAFALAEAGVLGGRRATTHWAYANDLARAYPSIMVAADAIYVRDGAMLTSAGVTAGIDVCLAMVEDDHGPDAARAVARDLCVFLQRPGGQSQFSTASRTPFTSNAALRLVLSSIADDPSARWGLDEMAEVASMSPRHLSRLFKEQLDTTPAAHVEAVRLAAARRLLERGESVTTTAQRSGLGSDDTLRRVFARTLGTTPSAYAKRFRSTR
jgi:transcriptional regulator GlxA family with amidase domain